jgi:hypothetical protein
MLGPDLILVFSGIQPNPISCRAKKYLSTQFFLNKSSSIAELLNYLRA